MYEIGAQELKAVERVLKRRAFFRYGGKETQKFESEWAAHFGAKSATAVTSGTAALEISLKAMGIGPGDSVLVPGYTFISTALAVTAVGAIPIVTEVDETLTMCPIDLEKKIASHTACVIPVHMQGMPCNLRAIRKVVKAHNLLMLEDCCQAIGGSYGKKRLGSIGDMGAFSFNVFKILSGGEGGAAITSNKKYAERAFMAQDGGCSVWPETGKMSENFFCGGNFRTNEISMAIMRVQLRRLDGILVNLRAARSRYLAELELPDGAHFVKSNDEAGNCGVCFLIQADSVERAVAIEKVAARQMTVHRPIHSGRHVYSAWEVVKSRVGGHHPDWNCFLHPKNRKIETNYDRLMERTDDYLKRTVLCSTPYGWKANDHARAIEAMNQAFARL